ncbi:hypothetical protein WICPIJ_000354 [Wickerhamomyces pijperi]|uniref:Uncharacterized protein n=1 Tax=Wickerhamomyces pijperi TaxID=599730 RepID=A0A9P8QDV3_WICPI|nr:hypothetical protein WICPIJ_000354 [Wickerhamomyces pijperi]
MAISPKKPYTSTTTTNINSTTATTPITPSPSVPSSSRGYGQKTTQPITSSTMASKSARKTVKKKPAGKSITKIPKPAGKSKKSSNAKPKPAGKSLKAPGKTILPSLKSNTINNAKMKKQRRFSLIESDSSLSDINNDDSDSEDDTALAGLRRYNQRGQFQAIESDSEEASEGSEDDSDSENEELWRNHAAQVVNTSSEDDDDDDSEEEEEGSSSSDDEGVDFVKLSNERKAKLQQQQHFRSASPFGKKAPVKSVGKKNASTKNKLDDSDSDSELSAVDDTPLIISPQKPTRQATTAGSNDHLPATDLQFTFDFNDNDNEMHIGSSPFTKTAAANQEEEEDLGEELVEMIPDFAMMDEVMPPRRQSIAPLSGFVNIEDSDSDSEINRDELLRTLEQESDGVLDLTGEEGDYDILKEEADNILQELGNGEDHFQFGSQNTHRDSTVDEMIQRHKDELNPEEILQFISSEDEYDDDEDDEDDFDQDQFQVPFFDDTAFLHDDEHKYRTNTTTTPIDEKENDSDDDSYLWDYFFSSGDERTKHHEEDPHTMEDIGHAEDDEETDEDTSLPPPSSRKNVPSSTTKAQELLSSSSVTARPPALGTWSTDSKPFGIIDGLSTRSLLPSSSAASRKNSDFKPSSLYLPHDQSVSPTGGAGADDDDDSQQMNIDDLLNISEFDDNSDDDIDSKTLWDEHNSRDRKVPLSAFRNKGLTVPSEHSNMMNLNAARRYSTTSSNGTGGGASGSGTGRRLSGLLTGSSTSGGNIIMKAKKKKLHSKSSQTELLKRSNNIKSSVSGSRQNSIIRKRNSIIEADNEGLVLTKSGLFHEDTLLNVEELLSGLGNEAELSILFQ